MGGLGKWAEDAWDSGKKAVGETVEGTAHIAAAGLDMVGLHGAAKTVDGWGDSAADELGADIPEKELGQTDDPKELLHGDPAAIREAAGHLRKFHAAFESTGSGLQRLDHDHWKGAAAEAFRKKFTPHPKQWLTAGAACEKAADALNTYAHTVEWAQQQAKECAEQYRSNSEAYDRAQNAYNKQVDTYNAHAESYNEAVAAGRDPGAEPVQPGKFDGDHYLTQMGLAEGKLHQARVQRDAAARTAGTAIDAATAAAPAEPSFATRLLDDGEDMFAGAQVARFHFGGGLVKGAADLVKFVRGLNPQDPYNITHPSMWLDHVSTTAAGMVHSGLHPNQLVSSVVGSGWGTDPGEALGKLTINLAAGTLTDGGSAEASVAEREAAGVAEDAGRAGVDTSHFEASSRLDDVRADLFNRTTEGLVPPRALDQKLLEDAMPRNPDGSFQKFADPNGPWVQLQNDGGLNVAGRSNNCADGTRAFLESWYGNPRVSAARTPDLVENGELDRFSPEDDALANQRRWAGADYEYSGPGMPGYAHIHDDLLRAGHGSSASITVNWPEADGGGGHAFAAVNYKGDVYWVDPQSGEVSLGMPINRRAEHVWHMSFDQNRVPISNTSATP